MNQAGEQYCQKWAAEYKKIAGRIQPTRDLFSNDVLIERAMRLGIEARAFDLAPHPSDPFKLSDDIERMAITSIKREYVEAHGNV